MGSQPLISICIPSYNGAPFIAETIESVLHQSFEDFELIIADDHSSDETVSIIERFRDPRLRLVRNPVNLGMGGNWSRVLSIGLGKYVKLLCEDDLLHSRCLERQVAVLEDPMQIDVALAICNREVINSRGDVVLGPRRRLKPGKICGRQLVKKCLRAGSNIIGEPVVGLFRRELVKRQNMCDPTNPYLSDLSLWAGLLKQGDAFFDHEVLASFRISSGAATASIGWRQASSFRRFARQLRNDPVYQITWLDLFWASLLSAQWCLLRNAFIRLQSGPRSGKPPQAPGSPKAIPGQQSHANCA